MMHSPIQLNQVSLIFPHKICFENFTTTIHYGDKIAIIGRNGSGKSTLLKFFLKTVPCEGRISYPKDLVVSQVPQLIDESRMSGGERFQAALTKALSFSPNCLLLDEPTNHLDQHHRKNLIRLLNAFTGTLIVVSHDVEFLRSNIHIFWYIDNGQINVFSGNYDDYIRAKQQHRALIEKKLSNLNKQKNEMHLALMKEQARACKSREKGQKSIHQRKWPTVVSKTKVIRAEETSGRKKLAITQEKQNLITQLANLRIPEIIRPTFSISASSTNQNILRIHEGSVSYVKNVPLLKKIHLTVYPKNRIVIQGNNGSGKSTFIKAILNDPHIIKKGDWQVIKRVEIGYLDQHYNTLSSEKTVSETIEEIAPWWSAIEVRRHLNDFLFRKNEEIYTKVGQLSGGERARLSLAQIAAKTPKLLILDEITNNLDLETKEHVIQVLRDYPGAIIVISHDQYLLNALTVDEVFEIRENKLARI